MNETIRQIALDAWEQGATGVGQAFISSGGFIPMTFNEWWATINLCDYFGHDFVPDVGMDNDYHDYVCRVCGKNESKIY